MKIAIIGATRGIGLAMAQAALADGHEVTALARMPGRMPISHLRIRIVAGDAQDPDAIANVVEGQDVICDCLGTTRVMQKITLFSRCAENLSKALKPEQLLIAVTGLGAGDSKGHCGFLYDRIFRPIVLRGSLGLLKDIKETRQYVDARRYAVEAVTRLSALSAFSARYCSLWAMSLQALIQLSSSLSLS